ncbi:MAG: hypothetical protein WBG08_08725 [Litorimonas sp.]
MTPELSGTVTARRSGADVIARFAVIGLAAILASCVTYVERDTKVGQAIAENAKTAQETCLGQDNVKSVTAEGFECTEPRSPR